MTRPTTREEFKTKCLRKLGAPVLDINVDDEQLEDLIDDGLDWFYDYHFDGSHRVLYRHQITQTDIDNRYVDLDETWIGVSRIMPINDSYSTTNLFNIRYQFHLNDLFNISYTSIVPYYQAMTYVSELEQLFVGEQPIRYNRHRNRLQIDMDWDQITVGEFIIIDGYQKTDPDNWSDVWSDRWLNRYVTALFKRQWGGNMKKFGGVQLPGGVELNGKEIYDEAQDEIQRLEEEMIVSYSMLDSHIIG